jgi:hypothetical protein
MKAKYGLVETTILPTQAEWNTQVGPVRSSEVDAVGQKLHALETPPVSQSFLDLEKVLTDLLKTPNAPAAATTLSAQVKAVRGVIKDCDTLMTRVEQLVQTKVPWPTKCLCAELYTANDDPWKKDKDIAGQLEKECRLTSGWAMNAPTDFTQFCEKGEADADLVTKWPQLAVKSKIIFTSQGIEWPPKWSDPWRKGLYCHSSAAIAAWLLDQNRVTLTTGLSLPIKSIDIVQQMPSSTGQMSHWWVYVNRPDPLTLSTGAKAVATANQWVGFDLVGGFVVDIWGALWHDQSQGATTWATKTDASNQKAVRGAPFIQIQDISREQARVHTRQVYS